jgi:hypothetical protein
MIDCFLRFIIMGIASTADLVMRCWSGWSTSGDVLAHIR